MKTKKLEKKEVKTIKKVKEVEVPAEAEVQKIADTLVETIVDKVSSRLESKLKKVPAKVKKVSALLDLGKLMKKDPDELTVAEKVVGFFQAILQKNETVLKALSEGVGGAGGYLFPDEFRAEIIRDIAEGPYMRGLVTVIPMKRDIMKIPTLTSRPKVTWTAENVAKSTTTAHFYEATLTVFKMAAIQYASDELIEDCDTVDVVQFIIGLFSEAVGNEEDLVIWRGDGTTRPLGIVTHRAAAGIQTITAPAGLDFDAIIDLIYELPGKYHANAKLFVHRHNIRDMRKLKDGSNRYYWQEPIAQGQPPTFYGYPVIEVNYLPSDEIYFGDLKKTYWLGDRKKMTVKISQDTTAAFTKDQTAIRIVERIAGTVILSAAIRCLNGI